MSWLTRYRIRLYVRNSMWLLPSLSVFAGLVAVALMARLDRAFGWEMNIRVETAQIIMGTVAGSMFTLMILVCSALLVAVQLASAQLTPRVIALIYRDPFRKTALSIFAFTFTFSVGVLARLEDTVPLLTCYVAAYGFLLNLALFLFIIDGAGKKLRPSTVLRSVALLGREVVADVYPRRLDGRHTPPPDPLKQLEGGRQRVLFSAADGVMLAFDRDGLASLAERSNCLIVLIPEVGDYVAKGDPLFCIVQHAGEVSEDALRDSVAIGAERAPERDPMFAFRAMVDIASKALSPAVNDPTTAVLAIDQIHHLLRDVGGRSLAEGRETDGAGRVRLVYRTPGWEDFVRLAVTEVRHYGRDSIQVVRRLRAMLEDLIETLPEGRAALLRKELALVESMARRSFPDLEDQTLAVVSDLQGLGGGRDGSRPREPARSNGAGAMHAKRSGVA